MRSGTGSTTLPSVLKRVLLMAICLDHSVCVVSALFWKVLGNPQLTQTAMKSGTGSATLPSVLKRVLLTILSTCFSVVQEGSSGPPVDTDCHEVWYRICDSAISAEESFIDVYAICLDHSVYMFQRCSGRF